MSLTRFRLKEATIWLAGLAVLAGAVVLSYRMGSTMFADDFAALTIQKKVAVGGVAVAGVALIGDFWTRSTVEFSALAALIAGAVRFGKELQEGETQRARSGREKYYSDIGDSIKTGLIHGGENALAVDDVKKRSQSNSVHPTIDREVSTMFLGQTNMGKSTQVKKLLRNWDLDEPVIAHALSEPGAYNELGEELDALGADTVRISSRGSDVRWDPFLDRGESTREMMNITEGVFRAHHTTETRLVGRRPRNVDRGDHPHERKTW